MKWSIHGLLTLAGTLAACGPSSTGATDPTDAGGDGSAQGGFDASAGDPDAGPPGRDASALQDSGVVAEGDGHVPSPDAAATLVQVPLGAYVGTWLGDTGSQYYTSWSDHWTAFVGAMGGRVPTVVGLPGMPYPPTNPDQWPNQSQYNVSNWPSVLPKSTSPLLTIWYVDANEQPIYAQAVEGTAYAGHSVDYWVQQTLQPYADFGVKKLYLRPAWEWNIGFQGQGITGDAGVGAATFVSAMQSFYTSAHAWGQASGVTVRVTWDPSVYGQDTNGITLAAQFPDQKPGDHYVDVICADFYAFGNSLATAPVGGPTVFTLTSVVALSQQWNLPLAFCELGDGIYDNEDPTLTWLPNLVGYLKQISTASPPVPIEFMNLWDIQSIEWTPPQVNRADEAAAWKAALGTGGSLMTVPVP